MTDWTRYPAGICVGCQKPAAVMPLCTDCRQVWEHDGDSWDNKDTHSQHVRDLASAWMRGYHRGYGLAGQEQRARADDDANLAAVRDAAYGDL